MFGSTCLMPATEASVSALLSIKAARGEKIAKPDVEVCARLLADRQRTAHEGEHRQVHAGVVRAGERERVRPRGLGRGNRSKRFRRRPFEGPPPAPPGSRSRSAGSASATAVPVRSTTSACPLLRARSTRSSGRTAPGKSTLGKIIAGAVLADDGADPPRRRARSAFRSPRDAIRHGIALIHQELALAPAMSVLDNVFLGVEPGHAGLVDRARAARAVRRARSADRLRAQPVRPGRDASRRRPAEGRDPAGARPQRAADRHGRADRRADARVEADRLLQITRDLRDDGVTVIYVSHILGDVLDALRHGHRAQGRPPRARRCRRARETVDSLVTAMLGRSMDLVFPARVAPPPADAPVVLSVRGLSRPPAFEDVSFEIRAGEIVGLAGLVGSGRTEIARAIFGADAALGDGRGRGARAAAPVATRSGSSVASRSCPRAARSRAS